jgi:hypothetical protein
VAPFQRFGLTSLSRGQLPGYALQLPLISNVRPMQIARKILLTAVFACLADLSYASRPDVQIEYSPSRDLLCSLLPGSSIKDEWKAELLSRQSEFTSLWKSEEQRFIEATEAASGKDFPSQKITLRLTLCNSPSESSPGTDEVSVSMRYALKSFAPKPVSMRYKVEVGFHELLHIFLFKHPVSNSILLREHAAEPERVQRHLHLPALQKAVLLRLKEPEALREVIAVDSELPGGYYKRAWEIINATDGEYLKYVAEVAK